MPTQTNRTRLSLTSRLLVWSIVFDPLLLFVFADRSRFGVTIALGRSLQVAVLALMTLSAPFLVLGREKRAKVTPPPRFLWSRYALFMVLTVLAGLLGVYAGAYSVPVTLEFNAAESRLAQSVNAVDARPLVDRPSSPPTHSGIS